MATVRIQEAASLRLDDIYRYTRDRWGDAQAKSYITGIFAAFEKIDAHEVASRPIPSNFGVDGSFFRYESHFVYWRRLSSGDIGIVTVLHDHPVKNASRSTWPAEPRRGSLSTLPSLTQLATRNARSGL